jgi:hypothetical protein
MDGYRETGGRDSACTKCPSESASLGVTIALLFVIIGVLVVIFAVVWRSDSGMVERIKWAELQAESQATHPGHTAVYTPEVRAHSSFTYSLKIVLSYLQIASSILALVG